MRYGANEVLQREYGSLILDAPEADYNVTLQLDLEQIPQDQGIAVLLPTLALVLVQSY